MRVKKKYKHCFLFNLNEFATNHAKLKNEINSLITHAYDEHAKQIVLFLDGFDEFGVNESIVDLLDLNNP